MCGILVCHKSFGKDFIDSASAIISKRGADCINSIEFDDYVFLHSRLIITGDSDNGNQPFETDTSIFLFNGEVYNYRYLNKLLKVPFSGDYSDSQVVHACITQYGLEIIDSFDGPFAIIYYDKVKRKIHAYRDWVGEKPLFYYESNSGDVYSSDLKIFKNLSITSEISDLSLNEYLSKGYVPQLQTLFKRVCKVRPWEIRKNKYYNDYVSYANNNYGLSLPARFECIANQIAYRNAALLLSGGVDSTLVACMLSKHDIHLYTARLTGDANDESRLACDTAKYLKLPITIVDISHDLDSTLLENIVSLLNEPVGDPGVINQYISLSKIKDDGRKVVFVGTGGDEIFFGYPRYRILPLKKLIDKIPAKALDYIKNLLLSLNFGDLNKNRIIKFFAENESVFMPEYDFKNYLPNQLFSAFDSLSFNNGIEARTPFTSILLLDHVITSEKSRLIDFVILKFNLKIILLNKFKINKFFTLKRGFTNHYGRINVTESDVKFNLFNNPDLVRRESRKSKLHLFRVFVLSKWLES